MLEGEVAAARRQVDGVVALDDLHRLVEVLEHAVEERERGLRVELHVRSEPIGQKSRVCSVVKATTVPSVTPPTKLCPANQ